MHISLYQFRILLFHLTIHMTTLLGQNNLFIRNIIKYKVIKKYFFLN